VDRGLAGLHHDGGGRGWEFMSLAYAPGMSSDHTERSRDFERFITFIDAIVAIAITLLVLPLVDLATELDGGSVTELLRDHRARIGSFLLSFVVIAALWLSQHRVLRSVISHDPLLTWLMLAWTLTIVILPFPTALVADVGSQPATKILYIGTMAISSALLTGMAWRIGRTPGIRDSEDHPDVLAATGETLAFVIALVLCLVLRSFYPMLLLLAPPLLVPLWRRKAQHRRR
jgi:uncharacterized membrane protein